MTAIAGAPEMPDTDDTSEDDFVPESEARTVDAIALIEQAVGRLDRRSHARDEEIGLGNWMALDEALFSLHKAMAALRLGSSPRRGRLGPS